MERSKKKLLGFATFWPFIYMVLFVLFVFAAILLGPGGGDFEAILGSVMILLLLVHFLTIFLVLGLQIYYIVHCVKNDRLTQNSKIAWIVGFFLGSFFAMPIYWYVAIWKAADEYEHRELTSGANFDPAYDAEQENRYSEQVPREPHSWR